MSSGFGRGTRGIVQVPLQRGEQIQRVLPPVGQRDAAFLLAEQHRLLLLALGLAVQFAADVDHVADIDQPDLPADREDPLPPVVVERRIAGHGLQAAVVAQPVAAERLELEEEDALQRGVGGAVVGLAFEDFQRDAEVELPLGPLGLGDDVASGTA